MNGHYLSADNAFIERRRRGLTRFANSLVRHPILKEETLVVMFLTVPTVCLSFPFESHVVTLSLMITGTLRLAKASDNLSPGGIRRQASPSSSRGISPSGPGSHI